VSRIHRHEIDMELPADANLSDLLIGRVRETPAAPAYRQFDGTVWCDWTWAEAARQVERWSAALAAEGLPPGERVSLCLRNRAEWVFFDQAALQLGLVTVPLYFDDRPDNIAFCLNDAGARLLLLEDGKMWEPLKDRAGTVERVVCLANAPSDRKAIALGQWLPARGRALARSAAKPEELATIVYTSGTTGRPKGVMLSHANLLTNVLASLKAIRVESNDRFVSFLPLSHTLERTAGYYLSLAAGAQTVYARGISVLADDIREQRPTALIAVPRIFERIHARMQEQMPPGSARRRLFEATVAIGWRRFQKRGTLGDRLWWPVLKRLVARKLHRRLGGRVRLVVVGGAALSPELSRVFIGLDVPIVQGYGLTETSPVISVNRVTDNDPNSVGRPIEDVEVACSDEGELLARGPNIMLGYWNNPEATRAILGEDGWLRTGDLARIRNGRIYITGRVKDIIVMSNGEKVSPGDAEAAIIRDAAFEQVMLVGEGRAKLGLLCVSRIEDERELCERANRQLHDFPGYARICHLKRVSEPWTVENGLLTPTLKLKRGEMARRFAAEIDEMYRRDLCRNGEA
jgi:long-chain acyl-CoA synthetase